MAKQKQVFLPAQDRVILEHIQGSTNITKSIQHLSSILNRTPASIAAHYYNVLTKPQRRLARLSNKKQYHVEGDPFVTRVVNYYDYKNQEHNTVEKAVDANLNYIAQEILDSTDIKTYCRMNRKKLEYLIKHKPNLVN